MVELRPRAGEAIEQFSCVDALVAGDFDRMTVRDGVRQEHPFRGLADAVKNQRVASVANLRGTMIGFCGPDVFQGLSVAEVHRNYLEAELESTDTDAQIRSAEST